MEFSRNFQAGRKDAIVSLFFMLPVVMLYSDQKKVDKLSETAEEKRNRRLDKKVCS